MKYQVTKNTKIRNTKNIEIWNTINIEKYNIRISCYFNFIFVILYS